MASRRRLHPAFVVTLGAITTCGAACGAPRTRRASSVETSGKRASDVDFTKLVRLNPVDDKGRVIRASGERCFVALPFEKPIKSWQPRPTKQVDCPKQMDDPAWDHCSGGEILRSTESTLCICTRDGNPPPPPREVPCPQGA